MEFLYIMIIIGFVGAVRYVDETIEARIARFQREVENDEKMEKTL